MSSTRNVCEVWLVQFVYFLLNKHFKIFEIFLCKNKFFINVLFIKFIQLLFQRF